MKVESRFLLFLSMFAAVTASIYWFTSYEDAGSVMLLAVCLLGLLPGGYYYWWSRRMTPRPEDDANASQSDGAGVVGAFPGSSIWPFVLGLGAAMTALAFVFGFWTALFGLTLAISAVIGVIVESRRGGVH
ncbi:MAG: cytochrome c oxidase subunit 4 [Actinomycetota bacterium]|nr:cytochrome c oxidase subunit 4 [Actinomycetota bacterium]